MSGCCSDDLANRDPGKISHARWLTTANRILRVYVSSENPSENLKILTKYIVLVYGPVWFNIKIHHSCLHGAKHLFDIICLIRNCCAKTQDIVKPVIQRNAFFGHVENMLLTMLMDSNGEVLCSRENFRG